MAENSSDMFAVSPWPSVAVIDGVCLGDLELALHVICGSKIKRRSGMPEVKLGLLPGGVAPFVAPTDRNRPVN